MKTFRFAILALAALLVGCPSSTIVSSSDDVSTFSSEESSQEISSSSQEVVQITPIADVRDLSLASTVRVEGVVAQHVYTGQETPYKTGVWLIDDTGGIYIYDVDVAESLEVGNLVVIEGNTHYYIPTNDQSAAESMKYAGTFQLINPSVIDNDEQYHEIPATSIDTSLTISDIKKLPIDIDITGNFYQLKGRIRVIPGSGYTNYEIEDLNRVDSIAFYTTSNGKDYGWLDQYDGQARNIVVAIINAKPQTNLWRFSPIKVYDEYTPSPLEEAQYAAQRALDLFADEYSQDVVFEIPIVDSLLDGVSRSYVSTDISKISIEQVATNNVVTVNTSEIGSLSITATAIYQTEQAEATKTVTISDSVSFEAITIEAARVLPDDSVVTLQGVIAQFTYKSGTDVPMGAFIIDATGSILIYNSTDFMPSLEDTQIGNIIAFSGTLAHYISDVEKANALSYTGDHQIMDITVLHNDYGQHDIPLDAITTTNIADIVALQPSMNISGIVYQIETVIEKVVSSYYTTYNVRDPDDTSKYINLYSQKQGSEFSWLDEYDGLTVTMLLGIQNIRYSSGSFTWRGCPIFVFPTSI